MAIRAVAALTQARTLLASVTTIPAASRKVYEVMPPDVAMPGIFLNSDVSIRLAGHGMSGGGPSSMEMDFGFWVVVEPEELDIEGDNQIGSLTAIAVGIAEKIQTSIAAGDWRGIGAPTVASVGIVIPDVDFLGPVIQVDFTIQGIF